MVSIRPSPQTNIVSSEDDLIPFYNFLQFKKYNEKTLLDVIEQHHYFSDFKQIIKKANMEYILDYGGNNFTLFVPINSDEFSRLHNNIDIGLARQIVKNVMINRKIPSELLKDSSSCDFVTNDPLNKLYVQIIDNELYINNHSKIIRTDIIATNGIIHVVDKIIWPVFLS
jgi:uncharacterized surface protein with fasciclin (FAS1) repeats